MAKVHGMTRKQIKTAVGKKVLAGEITVAQARKYMANADTHFKAAKAKKAAKKNPIEKNMQKAERHLKGFTKTVQHAVLRGTITTDEARSIINQVFRELREPAKPVVKVKTSSKAAPTVNKSFTDNIAAVFADENIAMAHTDPVMREAAQDRLYASPSVVKSSKPVGEGSAPYQPNWPTSPSWKSHEKPVPYWAFLH